MGNYQKIHNYSWFFLYSGVYFTVEQNNIRRCCYTCKVFLMQIDINILDINNNFVSVIIFYIYFWDTSWEQQQAVVVATLDFCVRDMCTGTNHGDAHSEQLTQ